MEFEIQFYTDKSGNSPIEEFLLKLEESNGILVARTKLGIEKLRNRFYHKEPLSKYIEPGLWEIRIKAGDILRIFYTFKKGKVIILLHIFIKKGQKIPKNELEIAKSRLGELKKKES